MKSVYCAVRTGSLNKAVCASYLKGYLPAEWRLLTHTSTLSLLFKQFSTYRGYLHHKSANFPQIHEASQNSRRHRTKRSCTEDLEFEILCIPALPSSSKPSPTAVLTQLNAKKPYIFTIYILIFHYHLPPRSYILHFPRYISQKKKSGKIYFCFCHTRAECSSFHMIFDLITVIAFEPGYNDTGSWVTPAITSDIPWYQSVCHC